jgi:signal transduction histidine kinase
MSGFTNYTEVTRAPPYVTAPELHKRMSTQDRILEVTNSESSFPPRNGSARPPRGPRRVRRNPHESYRALAEELAAAEDTIESLAMSEQEAWALANAARTSTKEVLSMLSHDIRTPLQAIYGYAELLEEGIHGDLNENQRTDVSKIQQSQHEVLNLLNRVMLQVRAERLASPQDPPIANASA